MEALKALGIDPWAVLLYLANFGLLLAVLTAFLYKPILKFLDERREIVRKDLEEVGSLRHALTEEKERSESESRLLVAEAAREVAAAKAEAGEKSRELLAEAEARRAGMMSAAEIEIADRKRKLVGEVEADLLRKIEAVTMRVLQEKVPAEMVKTSVEDAWSELAGS
jgi:F-type H+-transporting ATPase subunit b